MAEVWVEAGAAALVSGEGSARVLVGAADMGRVSVGGAFIPHGVRGTVPRTALRTVIPMG